MTTYRAKCLYRKGHLVPKLMFGHTDRQTDTLTYSRPTDLNGDTVVGDE